MSKSVIGARLIHRLSTVSGVTPTIPTNDDHTTGWLATDLYKSELFININDDRAWTRTNSGITEFVMTDRLTNKVPVSRMANEINGNFYISGGLSVGSLSGIGQGLRPIFASEDGLLITGAGVSGSGTVTQILGGLGLITNPSTGITTSGTIQMGTPNDITPLSTNSFPSNSGHTHKFVPAGNNTEIQFNSGNSISSSTNLKYDGIDLYVMNMSNSGTSYVLCYNTTNGRITYNMGSVVAGNNTEIQFNSGGSMSASPNLKYDGTDLYVMNMTQTGTSYLVYYNNVNGRFSYGNVGVSSITAGNGLTGGTISTNGVISLSNALPITYLSNGEVLSNGHDHRFAAASGIIGSIQCMTSTSGITGYDSFNYDGSNLFVKNMSYSGTSSYILYYNDIDGKITFGNKPGGSVTSISAGNGMSFSEITTSGSINLGTPSDINQYSTNNVFGTSHTHKFIPSGNNGEIQFNSGNTLFSSPSLTYNGVDLHISGMTSNITNDVIYYDSITGRLTYGVKPSGGGSTLPTGSTTFNIETKVIDTYLNTNYRFAVYDYVIYSGETNSRAGTITLVNNQLTDSRITESSTTDIGDTSSVSFDVINNGTNVNLSVTSTTSGWICEWIRITK